MKLIVKSITREQTKPYILEIHYAKRMPSISYSFGLFDDSELIGVCTFGTPPSATLRKGLCGEEFSSNVLELNRLCLKYNRKNEASFFVSKCLKMLPRPAVVVSFADKAQSHTGIVYQACNFIYCGLSAKRTDWKVKGREHLHGQTVADEFRGQKNRAKLMREKYGDDFYLAPRSRKHRYVYFLGSKKERKTLLKALKYTVCAFPS